MVARGRDVYADAGAKQLAARSLDWLLVHAAYPCQVALWRRRRFLFDGYRIPYHIAVYNPTWRSGRMVEIAIANHFLERHGDGRGIEIGNVLSYYQPVSHKVLDKYERAPDVLNIDVLDLQSPPLDWIVSISTLEHVGWDEEPQEPGKVIAAIRHLRGQLAPGGKMLVTVPRAHNPYLDEGIASGALGTTREFFMTRRTARGEWYVRAREEALSMPARHDGIADDVWVAEFGALTP